MDYRLCERCSLHHHCLFVSLTLDSFCNEFWLTQALVLAGLLILLIIGLDDELPSSLVPSSRCVHLRHGL